MERQGRDEMEVLLDSRNIAAIQSTHGRIHPDTVNGKYATYNSNRLLT